MTITINLTEQDVAQASKSLIGLIQSCAEIDLPDTPHTATTGGGIIVPEKVYKDEPIPAKPTPTAKAEPEPAPTSEPETGTKGEEKDAAEAAEAEAPLLEETAKDSTATPDTDAAKKDDKKLRETVKAECAAIARNGKSKALKALLADYSVEKLSELPDDKLEEFRTAARAL